MKKLISLEFKNNSIFYLAFIPITLFVILLIILNYFNDINSDINDFIYISIFFIAPIAIIQGFVNEKWSLYLALPVSRNKQLFIKLLLPLTLSSLYTTFVYGFLQLVGYRTVNDFLFFGHLLTIVVGLIIALFITLYLSIKGSNHMNKIFTLHTLGILMILSIFGSVMIGLTFLLRTIINENIILFIFSVLLDIILYLLTRYYFIKLEA